MPYAYDYLLTGATGQIGRYFLRELLGKGKIAVIMRRDNALAAAQELQKVAQKQPLEGVDVILGDLNDCNLPVTKHIINAAAYTTLANVDHGRYWEDNILPAVRLAHHAETTGAVLHQMSSIAVAEFRKDKLTEDKDPIPNTNQLHYSISKCMVELAVRAVSKRAHIYRLGDVIPPMANMESDWRRNHWLPILFMCGKEGFSHAPPDYGIWLADTAELAKAVVLLTSCDEPRYHVLGHLYHWKEFKGWALDRQTKMRAMGHWMTEIILHGPDGNDVDGTLTTQLLASKGFSWTTQGDTYWQAFAKQSMIRR